MILSLFCGAGGLDLGFERVGFDVGLAYDNRAHSVTSWNRNRERNQCAHDADIFQLKLSDMDRDYGSKIAPVGVIGGPPCQSFSRANHKRRDDDPRGRLVGRFFTLALRLHRHRRPLDFIVMENVPEIQDASGGKLLKEQIEILEHYNFHVSTALLDAVNFGVPQYRKRLFLVAVNKNIYHWKPWTRPIPEPETISVSDALGELPEPIHFSPQIDRESIPIHPNHWCMKPKSPKFFDGSLQAGYCSGRSFKTLSWDEPSITVSYGHREVHVHPTGQRRLSVFEAMKLQGFPQEFVLEGTLSSQIDQVSEAVPPPLAEAVAKSLLSSINRTSDHVGEGESNSSSSPASAEAA